MNIKQIKHLQDLRDEGLLYEEDSLSSAIFDIELLQRELFEDGVGVDEARTRIIDQLQGMKDLGWIGNYHMYNDPDNFLFGIFEDYDMETVEAVLRLPKNLYRPYTIDEITFVRQRWYTIPTRELTPEEEEELRNVVL